MILPKFQTEDRQVNMLQSSWAAAINPLLSKPILGGLELREVSLNSGNTIINHLLDDMQQGWFITDINGAATIYRSAPFNDKTLQLTSSAAVTVSLYVY